MKRAGFFMVVGLFLGLAGGYFLFKKPPATTKPSIPITLSEVLPKPANEYRPKIVYRDTGTHTILIDSVRIPVPVPVDTEAIVRDYLTVRHYEIDTTVSEISSKLSIDLYANKLIKYDLTLSNLKICKETANNGFKIGFMAGYHEFSPFIGYDHNRFTYLAGYNLYESGFKLGIIYKLKP